MLIFYQQINSESVKFEISFWVLWIKKIIIFNNIVWELIDQKRILEQALFEALNHWLRKSHFLRRENRCVLPKIYPILALPTLPLKEINHNLLSLNFVS